MKRTNKEDAYSHYDWVRETTEQQIQELIDLGSLHISREEYGRKFINKYQEDYEYDYE